MWKPSLLWEMGHVLWFKPGPQDSLLSQVFLHSSTRCHFSEKRKGGGGVMFLLRFVCQHLINVNNCFYGRCYGKITYCWLDLLDFTGLKTHWHLPWCTAHCLFWFDRTWAAISREEKLQPLISRKKRTLSLKCLSDIKSPSNTFADFILGRSTHLRVAVAEDIFFASKNPISKENNNAEDEGKLFLLSPKDWDQCERNWNLQRAVKFSV